MCQPKQISTAPQLALSVKTIKATAIRSHNHKNRPIERLGRRDVPSYACSTQPMRLFPLIADDLSRPKLSAHIGIAG